MERSASLERLSSHPAGVSDYCLPFPRLSFGEPWIVLCGDVFVTADGTVGDDYIQLRQGRHGLRQETSLAQIDRDYRAENSGRLADYKSSLASKLKIDGERSKKAFAKRGQLQGALTFLKEVCMAGTTPDGKNRCILGSLFPAAGIVGRNEVHALKQTCCEAELHLRNSYYLIDDYSGDWSLRTIADLQLEFVRQLALEAKIEVAEQVGEPQYLEDCCRVLEANIGMLCSGLGVRRNGTTLEYDGVGYDMEQRLLYVPLMPKSPKFREGSFAVAMPLQPKEPTEPALICRKEKDSGYSKQVIISGCDSALVIDSPVDVLNKLRALATKFEGR